MHSLKHRRGEISIIVIILLVLVIIGLVVWYAFWGKPEPQASPSSSQVASNSVEEKPDPYKNWKTYTLKYEKFSFKYPSDWTIADTSIPAPTNADRVSIASPDGFAVKISTNLWGIGGSCQDCKTFETTTETVLGEKTGVNIYGTSNGAQAIGLGRDNQNGAISYACEGLCTLPGKNAASTQNSNEPGLIMVSGYYVLTEQQAIVTGSVAKTMPYETFKVDPNVAKARLIFQSMTY